MFSTPKKRLFELKKELRCVKKIMDKGNRKAIKYGSYSPMWMEYNWGCGDNYIIITSDRVKFIIACDNTTFPNDLDFSKIIYIRKDLYHYSSKKLSKSKNSYKIYKVNCGYDNYDSLSGYFDIKTNYLYNQEIDKKFNVLVVRSEGS